MMNPSLNHKYRIADGEIIIISAIDNNRIYFKYSDQDSSSDDSNGTFMSSSAWKDNYDDLSGTISVGVNNPALGEATGGGVFDKTKEVQIEANAFNGNQFVKWDDGNTDNPRTITVTGDSKYTAMFIEKPSSQEYEVVVKSDNDDMGTAEGSGKYASGEEVEIKACPKDGFVFANWNDGDKNESRKIIVSKNEVCIANFMIPKHIITVLANDEKMGTVSGGGSFEANSVIQISATPKDGFSFFKWDDNNTSNPREIIVEKDSSFTACFDETPKPKKPIFTITVKSDSEAHGSVKGGGGYEYGSVIDLSASAKAGYRFVKWSDGDNLSPRSITVVKDAEYTAYFEKIIPTYDIIVKSCDDLRGVATGTGRYKSGTEILITATASDGYVFKRWDDGNTNSNRTIVVNADKTYTAIFDVVQCRLSLDVNDASKGIAEGAGMYAKGSLVNIKAQPKDGFKFATWNDEVSDNPRNVVVNADINYIAYFDTDPVAARLEQERKDKELEFKRTRLNRIISSIKIPEFQSQSVNVDLLNSNKADSLREEGRKRRRGYDKPSWFTECMWWIAGVDKNLLASCRGEYNKYVGVGTMILVTALMAALSCIYALNFVFDSWWAAVPIGLVWGMAIMFIDRFITSTLHGKNFCDKFFRKGGWVRFCISLLIGIVIAAPLELRVFEDGIKSHISLDNDSVWEKKEKQLKTEYNKKYDEKIDLLERDIEEASIKRKRLGEIAESKYKSDTMAYKQKVSKNNLNYINDRGLVESWFTTEKEVIEAKYNNGEKDSAAYEEYKKSMRKLEKDKKTQMKKLEIKEIPEPTLEYSAEYYKTDTLITSLNDSIKTLSNIKSKTIDSLLAKDKEDFDIIHAGDSVSLEMQLSQLHKLIWPGNDDFEMATLLIILLFILIDISPVLYKCLLPNGDYEKYMDPEHNETINDCDVAKNNKNLLKEELSIIEKNYIRIFHLWEKQLRDAVKDFEDENDSEGE